MVGFEALKTVFGKVGAGLLFLLKTWKWSITIILILFILVQNTATGHETGQYWPAYRDGIIKQIVTADSVIHEEVTTLKENNWQVEGLQTDGIFKTAHNFWLKLNVFLKIFESLWFIFIIFYLIWYALCGDHALAIIAHENFKATIYATLILITLHVVFNLYYLNLAGVTTVPEVLENLIPFKGVWLLITNTPSIIQAVI
jgi:hypothetical protein